MGHLDVEIEFDRWFEGERRLDVWAPDLHQRLVLVRPEAGGPCTLPSDLRLIAAKGGFVIAEDDPLRAVFVPVGPSARVLHERGLIASA